MITYAEIENSWHVLFIETILTVFDEIRRKHIAQICVCQVDMRTSNNIKLQKWFILYCPIT